MSRIERILVVTGLAMVALHVAGAFLPGPWSWGIHSYAFLPRPFLLLALFPLLFLVPAVQRSAVRVVTPLARSLEGKKGHFPGMTVFLAIMVISFFLLRTRTFLLSDSRLLIRSVSQGFVSFAADTLAASMQLWTHVFFARFLGATSDTASFRFLSIVSGIVWLIAMAFLVVRLTENGWRRLLLFSLLAASGLTKLFYGYAETAPLVVASFGIFLWAVVRLVQDRKGIVPATLAFLLATGFHVTGFLLVPAFVYGLSRWVGGSRARIAPAAGALLLPVVLYGVLWLTRKPPPGGVSAQYAPYFAGFIPILGPVRGEAAYTMFSLAHLAEFLNEQLFLGPLAILALGAAAPGRGGHRDERPKESKEIVTVLCLVLLPLLLLSLTFNRKLGGARDWDVVAGLAVPAILLTGLLLFEADDRATSHNRGLPGTALFLVAVSLTHLLGVVLVDVNPEWSVRRFAALCDDGAPMSAYARSYAMEELGHYYSDSERSDTAAGWFERAATVDPTNVKAIGTLGSLYSAKGRHEESLRLLREAVRLRPLVALNHVNLGAELSQTGQWSEAAASFTEAIRLDPKMTMAYTGLATAESHLGRTAAADSIAQAGLQAAGNGGNADLYVTKGAALEREGRKAEAESAYRSALQIDPANRVALFNLGRILESRESWTEASTVFERLTRLDPGDAEAAVNLGLAQWKLGRNEEAMASYRRAIRVNPRLAEAYLNLAGVLHLLGRDAEAASTLEGYIAQDPGKARELGIPGAVAQLRGVAGAH